MTKTIKQKSTVTRPVGAICTKAQVRDMIRGTLATLSEPKEHIIDTATAVAPTAGIVIPLTQSIIQGDDLNNRAGDKIYLKSIDLRAQYTLNVLVNTGTVRYVLFFDTQNTGSVPLVTDVLNIQTVTSAYQTRNHLQKRFHILRDQSYPLVLGGSNQTVHKQFTISVGSQIFYNGGSNIAINNGRNALFVLVLTDVIGANAPLYSFNHRLTFTDM